MHKKTGLEQHVQRWQTGRKRGDEGTRGRRDGELTLQLLLGFGHRPAPPSIALREMERQERKDWRGVEGARRGGGARRRDDGRAWRCSRNVQLQRYAEKKVANRTEGVCQRGENE